MLLKTQSDILKAYSRGDIGWRDACRRLDIEGASTLESLLRAEGLRHWQPSPEISRARMDALDALLYGEG